jgi:hypothetical protein
MGYLLLKWTKNYFYVMAKKEIIDLFLFAFFIFEMRFWIAISFCGLRNHFADCDIKLSFPPKALCICGILFNSFRPVSNDKYSFTNKEHSPIKLLY